MRYYGTSGRLQKKMAKIGMKLRPATSEELEDVTLFARLSSLRMFGAPRRSGWIVVCPDGGEVACYNLDEAYGAYEGVREELRAQESRGVAA